mmetsp:Transcript_29660/g.45447  ORF Transcript_29660/g.45447 Transcript_29660/m.45447 type:complete len:89 (+) Transcript_29660:2326-2592(+)
MAQQEGQRKIDVLEEQVRPCLIETEYALQQADATLSKAMISSHENIPEAPNDDPPPPQQLICPLTSSLMIDPVLAVDGQTYERQAIEE